MSEQLLPAYLKETVEKDGSIVQFGMRFPKDTPIMFRHMKAYKYWTTHDKYGTFCRYIEMGERCFYHFREAFKQMWPNFVWHRGFELELEAWCMWDRRGVTVIGATRQSKTYGLAHILLLDWLCDPTPVETEVVVNGKKTKELKGGTITSVLSSDLQRLRATLGKDISMAFNTCAHSDYMDQFYRVKNNDGGFGVYAKDDPTLSATVNATRREFCILGIGVANTKIEKVQGRHCDRRRMIYDEATGAPDAYFDAEKGNVSNAPDYKGFHLANPTDRYSKFGLMCEPKDGWGVYDLDDEEWISKHERLVIHLDAYKSHNFNLYHDWRAGKLTEQEYKRRKFDWMLDFEGVEKKYKEGTAEWYTFVRGGFPPDGLVNKVFPSQTIELMKQEMEFDFPPKPFALCDPAYEHDKCVVHIGHYGLNREGRMCAMFKRTVHVDIEATNAKMSKDKQIALRIIAVLDEEKVHPTDYIQDKTGNGRSVYSHIQDEWDHSERMSIHGCEFGGPATDRILHEGEEKKCKYLYKKFVDELWFRMAEWGRMGCIFGLENLDEMTQADLNSREYFFSGDLLTIYDKASVKKTLGRSPDDGDAFVLFSELMMRKNHVPSRKSINEDAGDPYEDFADEAKRLDNLFNPEECFSETSDW